MSTKDDFKNKVASLAKTYGMDIESNTDDEIALAYRSSAGNDEPTRADYQHVRAFAKELSVSFPDIKKPNVASMDDCDEWIDLSFNLKVLFPSENFIPKAPKR